MVSEVHSQVCIVFFPLNIMFAKSILKVLEAPVHFNYALKKGFTNLPILKIDCVELNMHFTVIYGICLNSLVQKQQIHLIYK